MLRRLIYLSSSTSPRPMDDLEEILGSARRRNEDLDVTGVILTARGSFLQVLEGSHDAVETVWRGILSDPRHRGVIKMLDSEAEERRFPDWSMAHADLPKDHPLAERIRRIESADDLASTAAAAIAPEVDILIDSFLER